MSSDLLIDVDAKITVTLVLVGVDTSVAYLPAEHLVHKWFALDDDTYLTISRSWQVHAPPTLRSEALSCNRTQIAAHRYAARAYESPSGTMPRDDEIS